MSVLDAFLTTSRIAQANFGAGTPQRGRATAAIILLVTGLLSGCFFGAGNDSADKSKLKDTVAGMPGVTWAVIPTREEGVLATVELPKLYVTMATATPQQIRAVVDVVKNNPHEELETLDIGVSDKPSISISRKISEIDTDRFIDDAERLRQLVPVVGPSAVTDWTRDNVSGGALVFRSLESPLPATLSAIQEILGNDVLVEIWLGASSRVQHWKINLPLSPDEERHVNSQLESVPVQIGSVTVESGAITGLTVAITDNQAAESELSSTIAAVGAGSDAPLMLSWYVGPQMNLAAQPNGTVHVGGCGYPNMPGAKNDLSPEEKALQERMRQQFDTCPR
ncbi:hypothetical protein ABQF34_09020 [Mycolicibacterium boenickei]